LCYFAETGSRREKKTGVSPLSKIALVFVRLDHVARPHRDYGERFIVRSDELLTAFLELERAIHELTVSLTSIENRGCMVVLSGKARRKN